MSRAIMARTFGGPEVLEFVEIPTPAPGPGQVTIGVQAAGVNPSDLKKLQGMFGRDAGMLPLRLGGEISGVVTAVGPEAFGPLGAILVGDHVLAYRVEGGFSEELTVPAQSVLPKPSTLSWKEAAGLLLVGVTAFHMVDAARVTSGDRVVVHGASGSVGSLVTQLAIHRGASVAGTASPANQETVRSLGAEPVMYGDGLADRLRATFPRGADAALDTVGTDEALNVSSELVPDRARIVTIAGYARGAELGVKRLGGPGGDLGTELRNAARARVVELAGRGELKLRMGLAFPLDRAAEALELIASGHPGGKIVLISEKEL